MSPESRPRGFVSLVGAGPGDPELLTLKAHDRIGSAELVLFDALVSSDIISLATNAQWFCVGKRAGRQSVRQDTIVQVMIRAARRGRRVVRLKSGDPFVLGRGAEEALALRAAGVDYEIVSGLTTAIAAPAGAGIPLTHRGMASSFLVMSGHDASVFRPVLAGITPASVTLVVLMGMAQRAVIAGWLMSYGWPADTPAAIVCVAGVGQSPTWIGSLGDLGTAPHPAEPDRPGTIVIGRVVDLHSLLGTTQVAALPMVERKG
ncbi:MAG: uroporphyrinogen-III C-methyltransferase [Acidobacteriota bacterium]|nr:uroporphyrinogen-III C-methyltransferase [Acidobacteriota bacterium]